MPNARAWFYSQSFNGGQPTASIMLAAANAGLRRLEEGEDNPHPPTDLVSAPPERPGSERQASRPELDDTDHHVLGDDLNIYDVNGGEEI